MGSVGRMSFQRRRTLGQDAPVRTSPAGAASRAILECAILPLALAFMYLRSAPEKESFTRLRDWNECGARYQRLPVPRRQNQHPLASRWPVLRAQSMASRTVPKEPLASIVGLARSLHTLGFLAAAGCRLVEARPVGGIVLVDPVVSNYLKTLN